MINVIARRKLWYTISASVLIPATIILASFGLKLGIDFTGGAVLEVAGKPASEELTQIAHDRKLENVSVTSSGSDHFLLRYKSAGEDTASQTALEADLKNSGWQIIRFDQVGPSISRDLVKNALLAIGGMSLAIIVYITWAFRKVPKGVSAVSFGVATLVAAFAHDALFVLGIFAILGKLLGVEVDSYIVTAILTVIGFSIHDTVVVFDRIREKLASGGAADFVKTVNDSVNETLVRSLNTSLVIVLVLLAMFLFGGASIRHFVLALILGMISGTYSSIFIASPLLVTWHQRFSKT